MAEPHAASPDFTMFMGALATDRALWQDFLALCSFGAAWRVRMASSPHGIGLRDG